MGVALLAALSGPARAAPIDGFQLSEFPSITVVEMLVAYDSTDDILAAISLDVTINLEDSASRSVDGSGFRIVLSVDGSGLQGEGSVEILGRDPDQGLESGVLLTGEITDFGWFESAAGPSGISSDELQFVFAVTGGDLADVFGETAAMSLTGTGFNGNWSSDWANGAAGTAVVASPIPLPPALALLVPALAGLLGFTRRRVA